MKIKLSKNQWQIIGKKAGWHVISQARSQANIFYHVSNHNFKKFNPRLSAQGIIWFSSDKEDLLRNMHGASVSSKKPIYLYTCQIDIKNPANRDQYDKLTLGQLYSMKHDAIILEDDIAVLDPKIISIVKKEIL